MFGYHFKKINAEPFDNSMTHQAGAGYYSVLNLKKIISIRFVVEKIC